MIKLDSPIKIQIEGINLQKITQFASKIYNICPPEPYKGKGIKFVGEKQAAAIAYRPDEVLRRKMLSQGK